MSSELCLISLNDISREGLHRILSASDFDVLMSCRHVERVAEARLDRDFTALIDLPDRAAQMDAIRQIAHAYPHARIAVLADQFEMERLIECFDAGVDGYIVKSMNCDPLITALRLVAMGEKVLPSQLAEVIGRHNFETATPGADLEHEMDDAKLSLRERDVLCCLMAGHSNKVIARELDVCEATVKVHVKAILRKLDVSNRTQAAMWASTRGFSNYHNSVAHPRMAMAGA